MVILLTSVAFGCGDSKRLHSLAGTYVTVHDEGGPGEVSVHSRLAITFRPDYHWTSKSELEIGGKDMLAGGRVGDEIAPPGYTDSGTFALKGDVVVLNSAREGISEYLIDGDTLWAHNARQAALATAVTGVPVQRGPDTFLLRQR
jgi:hypothetical protein